MNDEANGLVDDEQRLVGVQDIERYRLGLCLDRGFELGLEVDLFTAPDEHAGLGLVAPDLERTGVDPGAQAAAREFGQQRGGGLIQATAGQLRGDGQAFYDAAHGGVSLK